MQAGVDRLSTRVPVRQNLTAFINDLTNLQADITLILDDYHTISACCSVVVWYEMTQIANQQGDAGILQACPGRATVAHIRLRTLTLTT